MRLYCQNLARVFRWYQKLKVFYLNLYKRGLETCPQANLHQSGREYCLNFSPTRPSDEYDSAPSRKYSRPLLDVFTCIGYPRISNPYLSPQAQSHENSWRTWADFKWSRVKRATAKFCTVNFLYKSTFSSSIKNFEVY